MSTVANRAAAPVKPVQLKEAVARHVEILDEDNQKLMQQHQEKEEAFDRVLQYLAEKEMRHLCSTLVDIYHQKPRPSTTNRSPASPAS